MLSSRVGMAISKSFRGVLACVALPARKLNRVHFESLLPHPFFALEAFVQQPDDQLFNILCVC